MCCTALNIQEAFSITPRKIDDVWHLLIKYKDMDGKMTEHLMPVARETSTLKAVTLNLVSQVKEVSGSLVTTELENAIARGT